MAQGQMEMTVPMLSQTTVCSGERSGSRIGTRVRWGIRNLEHPSLNSVEIQGRMQIWKGKKISNHTSGLAVT